MKVKSTLTFLGISEKTGRPNPTTGEVKQYKNAKFNHEENNEIFDFFLSDKQDEQFKDIQKYSPCEVTMTVETYQGNINVRFAEVSIKKVGGQK